MVAVATLEGPVDAGSLGRTLMHEHVITLDPEILANYPGYEVPTDLVGTARQRLVAAKASGVDTIVDLTVIGLGRNIELVAEIADGTGLQIIVATGLYTFDELPRFFRFRGPGTPGGGPEPLVEMFVRDIVDGIADTGVHAGMLKFATDLPGVTPAVERTIRACARAHRQTGVPISTHAHAGTRRGLEQQRLLREEGVDLSRIVIGHCGDCADLDYLTQLMDAGSTIGMDRFGLDIFLPTDERIETIKALVDRGYVGQLVLSHDACAVTHVFGDQFLREHLPNHSMTYLMDAVVPLMLERGIAAADIETMLVDNPARFFSATGAY